MAGLHLEPLPRGDQMASLKFEGEGGWLSMCLGGLVACPNQNIILAGGITWPGGAITLLPPPQNEGTSLIWWYS